MKPIQGPKGSQSARFYPGAGNISGLTAVRSIGLFLAALLFFAPGAWARPTTADEARNVAVNWLSLEAKPMGPPMGHEAKNVETFTDEAGDPAYYVVHLKPSGLIFLPADDQVEPIIGFVSGATSYDPSPANPLGALVSRDIPGRIALVREKEAALESGETPAADSRMAGAQKKWAWLSVTFGAGEGAGPDLGNPPNQLTGIPDVRVAPFVQSQWNQACAGGGDPPCSLDNPDAYNYYTPNGPNSWFVPGGYSNYYCGCAATAMAQILRYFRYPTDAIGVERGSYSVGKVKGHANLLGGDGSGGPYDWPNMPLTTSGTTPIGQLQDIGRLTWDAGLAVDMDYSSSGSSPNSAPTAYAGAFMNFFRYSNAVTSVGDNLPEDMLYSMVNTNLHAKYPVMFSIHNSKDGHAIVCDGYGYVDSVMYHHLNMGWSGSDNAWYNLPTIDATQQGIVFTAITSCTFNIYRRGSGEIIAGRVVEATGNPIEGAEVVLTGSRLKHDLYTVTDAKGVFALTQVPSNSQYTVKVGKGGYTFPPRTVKTGWSSTLNLGWHTGNVWMQDWTAQSGKPTAPTGVTATAGDTQATVRFTAPTSNGGSPTAYAVYSNPGTGSIWGTASPITFKGLENGVTYTFTVTAMNAQGLTSPPSSPSNKVTPERVPSTTTVTSGADPSVYRGSVTFKVKVDGVSGVSGGGPSGTVQFTVDGTDLGGPVTLFGGSAISLPISSLSTGNHKVSANYSGDVYYARSTGTLSKGQTVNKAASTTTVTSSANSSIYGQAVTFTAYVRGISGAPPPTGTVQFTVGGTNLGSPVNLTRGSAAIQDTSVTSLPVGNHSVKAVYNGDNNFKGSTGVLSGGQTVNTAASTITLSSSIDPSLYGQAVTFKANVAGVSGAAAPTGTVQFTVDGNNLYTGGPVPLSDGSAASSAISSLSRGNHAVAANYSGDANYTAGIGTLGQGQGVNTVSSTTTVTSNANPSSYGQAVTFTAKVAGLSGGGTPTGKVQFMDRTQNLGEPVSLSGGSAVSSATSSLSAGNHTITASYLGDNDYMPSSGTLPGGQTVNAFYPTATTVGSSENPSLAGDSIAFMATVTSVPVGITFAGTVQFVVDGTNFGDPVSVTNYGTNTGTIYAVATSTSTSSLTPGNHTATANYSRDNFYIASSGALSGGQNVRVFGSATTVASSKNPSMLGNTISFTAIVSGGDTEPTGTVQFVVDGKNFGDPVEVNPMPGQPAGVATSASTSSLSQGTHTVTANYSGDVNYMPGSGTLSGGQIVEWLTMSHDSGTALSHF